MHHLQPWKKGECAISAIGIQAQLIDTATPLLNHLDKVIFDTILDKAGCGCKRDCDCNIYYQKETGDFILRKCGSYLVNWTVAVEGSSLVPQISFALQVRDEIFGAVTLPVSVGLVSGSSLIVLRYLNTKVSLVNNSEDIVRLADVTPISNLVITKI